MQRFSLVCAAGLLLLAMASGLSQAQEPVVLIDSRGWNAEKEDGLTTLRGELEKRGLVVKTTSEVGSFAAPPLGDAVLSSALVVITDRRESYSAEEIDAVDRYVWVGGSLLCSTDSDVSPSFIPGANSLLASFDMRVSPEGEVGKCTRLAEHPINAEISSVVNDDGPVSISFRFGTALAQVGDAVVAVASEQGYGKVGVVDADIIYDGEGKNIGLGDNRAFAANLVLWLAGEGMAPPAGTTTQPSAGPTTPEEPTETKGKPVTCPLCGGGLMLLEKEGNLAVAPPGEVGDGVYRFAQEAVVALKDAGRWAVFGLEIEMLPGVPVEAELLEIKRDEILRASAGCFSETKSGDLSDDLKVQAIRERAKGEIDRILGGGKVQGVRLKPLFVASGP